MDFLWTRLSALCSCVIDGYSTEFADRREGMNPAVRAEVGDIFKGKTTEQLRLLGQQMKMKLMGGEGIDVGEQ